MIKKQLSFLLFLLTFNSFSQSLEKLKTDTSKLYEANYLMDFEAIIQFTYPKIVEPKIGRQATLDEMEMEYENENYRMRLQLENVRFQYGAIKEIEGRAFCVITFQNPTRYTFETKLTDVMIAEKKSFLQEINHTKEVTFEPTRNSFNVRKTTTYVAVFDESTKGEWKFFNLDIGTQHDLFEVFFKDSKKELGL